MSKDPERRRPAGDYVVGYGRPPVASRFQPGQSGNPRGRPKGSKPMARAIAEALERRVTIQEGGRQRKMPKREVIIHGLVNEAARGNAPALKQLFALMDRYPDVHKQPQKRITFTLDIGDRPKANDEDPTE